VEEKHYVAGEGGEGWGAPNSDDWKKSKALCILCGVQYWPVYTSICHESCFLKGWQAFLYCVSYGDREDVVRIYQHNLAGKQHKNYRVKKLTIG